MTDPGYIRLSKVTSSAKTVEIIQDTVLADYSDTGKLIGIEILAPFSGEIFIPPSVEQSREGKAKN